MCEPMEDTPGDTTDSTPKPSYILRPGSMVMMSFTVQDYETQYWPKLENAIQHLLTTKPSEYIPISYEQMYTCVYKCVCKQFSERLFADLLQTITAYLEQVHLNIQVQAPYPVAFVTHFHSALTQYLHALQAIVPVFNYMNRFYIETKLKTDLATELKNLFITIVSDRHVPTLISMLVDANLHPFAISPPVMSTLIKNLYCLKPDYVQLRPQLFAKYIPNVLPPCSVSDIDHYVQEVHQLQRDLLTHPDFISGDQSRKRPGDDDDSRPGQVSSRLPNPTS